MRDFMKLMEVMSENCKRKLQWSGGVYKHEDMIGTSKKNYLNLKSEWG